MRLLWWVDHARSGAENMRLDRALLARADHDPTSDPVLRVYSWTPPAVSLGFHQSADALDPERLRAHGIDLVRRPTGGAAVLHHEEITYSVSGPLGLPELGRRVLSIHDGIAAVLRGTLAALGVAARAGGDGRPRDFACFAAAGGHEIAVDGRKLLGSALRRGRHAFLQHGSLLVGDGHLDLPRLLRAVDDPEGEIERLRRRTCTLRELGAAEIDAERFAAEASARLGAVLGVEAHRIEGPAVLGILDRGGETDGTPG